MMCWCLVIMLIVCCHVTVFYLLQILKRISKILMSNGSSDYHLLILISGLHDFQG